jgi:hypothetical protein
MDLDEFIISVFCLIDESLPIIAGGHRPARDG